MTSSELNMLVPEGKLFNAMMAASDGYSASLSMASFCSDEKDEPAAEKRQEFYC